MKVMRYAFFIVCIGLFTSLYGYSENALSSNHVAIENAVVNMQAQKEARIRFSLSKSAEVTLAIYDDRRYRVYTSQKQHYPEGDHIIYWSGRDQSGQAVPSEVYYFAINASANNESVIYDVKDQTGGNLIGPINTLYDPTKGIVSYTLTDNARVVLRAGIADGPMLITLLNWVPRTQGAHQLPWNGKDSDDLFNIARHPKLRLVIDAFTLPDNTLFVYPESTHTEYVPVTNVASKKNQPRPQNNPGHAQSKRDPEIRRDFPLVLSVSKETKQNRLPIHVNVDSRHLKILNSSRFEVSFFLDGVYQYENEIAFLPMTHELDLQGMGEGEHVITVNVAGFDGNFAAASVRFTHAIDEKR